MEGLLETAAWLECARKEFSRSRGLQFGRCLGGAHFEGGREDGGSGVDGLLGRMGKGLHGGEVVGLFLGGDDRAPHWEFLEAV